MQSLAELIVESLSSDGERPALQYIGDGPQVCTLSRRRVLHLAAAAARKLLDAGLRRGDTVLHLAENRWEWAITDFAILLAGGVHVPVHAPLTAEQVGYQLRDSGAKIAVVSNAEQAAKLADGPIPDDFTLFSYQPLEAQRAERWIRAADRPDREVVDEVLSQARAAGDDVATILYTSGTTGDPKGVVLSHANLLSNATAARDIFRATETDVRLAFLPLSHIFARTCDLYLTLAGGMTLAVAESRESVVRDCALVKPTMLNGVPYFFDKIRRHLIETGRADQPGVLQQLFGGRMRILCSGGAALPDHLFDFFAERGLPVLQGYGLSESSPIITVSDERRFRRGSVGLPIPGVEVSISSDGEILTRGPHVMVGYYKNEAATRDVIRDGWLHTGDLGRIDDDGFVYITGRKKELIVTSGGKNIAPVMLEQLLTEDPLILQAMVVGDDRNYLTALIVPDEAQLRAQLSSDATWTDVVGDHETKQLVADRVHARLRTVSRYEQIAKCSLLPDPFSIENGMLTPKLSLRRREIAAAYAAEIASMYESD